MRRTICYVNVVACMARGRRDVVCAFTSTYCKIGHTVRSTCVYVRNLLEATRTMRFYRGLHRKIARSDARLVVTKCLLLTCWILRT